MIMLNLPVKTKNEIQVMSSLDLAKLCVGESKDAHSNFMKKAEKVLGGGVVNFYDTYKSVQGKDLPCLMLPEREACLMAMSYSYELQAYVFDAWQSLKLKSQPSLPSAKELALMVIKAEEEKEAAMLEVDRLQGVCNTITAQFAKGTSAPVFCRQLNGVNVQQVNNRLIEMGMLLKTQRGLEPTSYARDKYFKVIYIDKTNEKTGWSGQKAETTLTLAGAKWLYRAYISNRLPMKKTWDGNLVHVEFNQ